MVVICLNIWGGRAGKEKLLSFFEKYRDIADVFCLQEVWAKSYDFLEGKLAGGVPIRNNNVLTESLQEISKLLPDHTPYFHPGFYQHFGLCSFVSKSLDVVEDGDVFVHRERGYIVPEGEDVGKFARNIQYMTIQSGDSKRTVMNFHGLWNGQGKGDSDERLAQSKRIVEFVQSLGNPFVLVGDFNLTPETESLGILERSGLRNLVTEYGITSTRTSLYTKPGKHANYAFVSPEIEVKEFKVLPDVVSDHAPLYLDFS